MRGSSGIHARGEGGVRGGPEDDRKRRTRRAGRCHRGAHNRTHGSRAGARLDQGIPALKPRTQQFREAELMPVWINDMKESLAPGGILRRINHQSLSLQSPVMCVHVIDSENSPAPPPAFVSWTRNQVHEGFTGLHAAE